MHWQSDVSVADWIAPLLSADWSADHSMHMVIPRGYEAYARIFHPASKREIPGGIVPSPDEMVRLPPAQQDQILSQFVDTAVIWDEVASAFGTTMHPLAQWHAITRADSPYVDHALVDGVEYRGPDQGFLDAALLAALVQVALEHTNTPNAGFAAVWEGWGDLVGSMREIGQGWASFSDEPATHHDDFLAAIHKNPFENPYGKQTWHEGIVSDEISRGERLRLPGRDYVLFAADTAEFARPTWQDHVMWRNSQIPQATHGPALLWPTDRAFVIASEIDFDSTLIGGSEALIDAVVADPRLEALRLPAEADLTSEGDRING